MEDPNDCMRKKHIVIKTKVLRDVMGVVKDRDVCVPLDIVSTLNFCTPTNVALTLPIQREFLWIFEDKVVQNSTPLGIRYFFCSLQTVVGCVGFQRLIFGIITSHFSCLILSLGDPSLGVCFNDLPESSCRGLKCKALKNVFGVKKIGGFC